MSNFISIATKLIKFIINFTLKIKFNIRNDGHYGQFKRFSKKANIFGWNVLRSTMFQVFLEKSIKYQLKKWISKKVFIFYFWKVLKLNFANRQLFIHASFRSKYFKNRFFVNLSLALLMIHLSTYSPSRRQFGKVSIFHVPLITEFKAGYRNK